MSEPPLIIYDGDCIFCHNYVRLVRLQDAIGKVELIDARTDDPRVKRFWRQGYDLNAGMIFVYEGKVHHGSDAVYTLAGLSSKSSLFNRLLAFAFSSRFVAELAYPLLKLGRRVTLALRGKKMIEPNLTE